jgi:hypothetical protein
LSVCLLLAVFLKKRRFRDGLLQTKFLIEANEIPPADAAGSILQWRRQAQIPDTADAAPLIIMPTYSRDQRSSMARGQGIYLHIYIYGRSNKKKLWPCSASCFFFFFFAYKPAVADLL